MTTRPTLDTTPEDASLSKWARNVENFVENLVGSELIPSAPKELKVVSEKNSVKVSFRAVNEVGVSEYQVFRGPEKHFSGGNAELIATITQAVDPATTTIVYTDPEAVEKKFYFVRGVKGLRRPKIVGSVAGHGTAVSGKKISEQILSGEGSAPGSVVFIDDDGNFAQDSEDFFWNQDLKRLKISDSTKTGGIDLPQNDSALTPTLRFGDGDTGFYEQADDVVRMSLAATARVQWDTTDFRSLTTGGFAILYSAASATVPSYTFQDDPDTGIGSSGADEVSVIAGASEIGRFESTGLGLSTLNLAWGSAHGTQDTVLVRDGAADTLALKRGTNNQTFRVYETFDSGVAERLVEIIGLGVSGGAEVMADTISGATSRDLIVGTRSGAASPAITVTTIAGSLFDETDSTTYTFPSWTPVAGKVYVVTVSNRRAPTTVLPTLAGNGITWTQVATTKQTFGGGENQITVFRGLASSPSTGTLVATFSNTQLRGSIVVQQLNDVDTGGTNGSNAIVQTAVGAGLSVNSVTATLGAFSSADNATLGLCTADNPSTQGAFSPGTGFGAFDPSLLTGSQFNSIAVEFRNDNDTSVDFTSAGSAGPMQIIGLELKRAGAGTGGALKLYTDNTNRWSIDSTPGHLTPFTDALQDIGGASNQIKDLYLGESFIQSDPTEPHVFGGATLDYVQLRLTGGFTSGGASTRSALFMLDGALTGAGGDTTALYGMDISPFIVTQTATESIADIATLNLEEPMITDNLTGNITEASTLRIGGAPTEGVANYAIKVEGGLTLMQALEIDGDLDHDGSNVGFFGTAPVAQAAAYTQTFSTADRTLGAYTADDESAAYTGLATGLGGTPYADVTDLNALRVAYENLRAFVEDGIQMLNAAVDDLQSYGLLQ